jgi:phage shock protein A
MSTVVKAKISHLLDRAEDPAETLDYSYEKQLEQLQNVKRGIADIVTAKKRLQLQETSINEQIAKLDGQARQAMVAGREDLARTALERKHVAEGEMQSLDQQVAQLEDQQQKLTDSEKKLQTKIEAFRTKKEVIKAEYSAAEAQVRISEAASGVGEQMADVGLAMQRALDKTENMKARADAVSELEAAGTFDDITQLGRRRTTSTVSWSSSGGRALSTTIWQSSRPSWDRAPSRRPSSMRARRPRRRREARHPSRRRVEPRRAALLREWAIQDSNLKPLPYQGAASPAIYIRPLQTPAARPHRRTPRPRRRDPLLPSALPCARATTRAADRRSALGTPHASRCCSYAAADRAPPPRLWR